MFSFIQIAHSVPAVYFGKIDIYFYPNRIAIIRVNVYLSSLYRCNYDRSRIVYLTTHQRHL